MVLSLEQALAQLDVSVASFRRIDATLDAVRTATAGQAHFIAILSGAGTIHAGSDALTVTTGTLVLLPGTLAPQPGPGLVVAHGLFHATLLDGRTVFDHIPLPHRLEAAGTELFTGAIPELLREYACGGAGADAIVACLARRLITALLRNAWMDGHAIPSSHGASRRARLDGIVGMMKKDPGRDYTLESLADAAALSRTLFHRAFVEAYGITPLAMLRGLRLQRAGDLLRHTDLPIKTVRARLGYRSHSHFSKLFADAFGAAPEGFCNAHRAVHR
jgi:AraC-like DNA-binding protein